MNQELSVYVSYSHADRAWKERLVDELRNLRDDGRLGNWDIWDDSRIGSGETWEQVLEDAMEAAQAAILLISEPYLNSPFVTKTELPHFLGRREAGFLILPVLVARSDWQSHDWLRNIQLLPRDLRPLAERAPEDAEKELRRIAVEVGEVLLKAEPALRSADPLLSEAIQGSSHQDADRPTVDDALLPLEDIDRRYKFSPTARAVIDRAREAANSTFSPVPVTSSFLLFAMIDQGRSRNSYASLSFLWNFIAENIELSDYDRVRFGYLRRQRVLEAMAGSSSEVEGTHDIFIPRETTRNTLAVLEQAWALTRSLGETEIHSRHLLAGLLVDQPDGLPVGAHRRLQEMRVDRSALCAALLAWIGPSTGKQQSVWEEFLLGREGDARWLSGYTADAARGRDLIGISRDVDAFATLIAAESVRPPLAIGLFGEWGSGKTFFINQLRAAVDSLAKRMNEASEMQRDLPFYKRIVQIEFNAWHYVQGELWPSLMQHILDNLRLPGEQETLASQELRNHLIQKLQEENTTLEAVEREFEDAKDEVGRVKDEVSAAEEELRVKERELRETSVRVDLQDFELPQIRSEVDIVLSAMGMPPVSATARDLGSALQEARDVLHHGLAILTPLVRAEDRERRWNALLLGLVMVPLVGLLIGLIPVLLGQEAFAQVTTLTTGVVTLIGVLTTWLRSQTAWLKEHIDKVDAIQRRYDASVTEELAKYTERVREQGDELRRLRDYLAATERKKEEAERRVAAANDRLKRATTTSLLADYIQDRAASQDYRRHLGVLALIRNDFEKLSGLMEEENRRLYTDEKIATLEDEKEGEAKRINRIVLYIDDLDRCPPKVVTDVLQAVHLLLAFPLFVVVVAVDARWIKRSLRARYEELLHTGDPELDRVESDELFGKATPDDYLEKIFQIPFWLRPVGQDASRRMVEGLLRDSLAASKPNEPTGNTGRGQRSLATSGLADGSSDASPARSLGDQSATRQGEEGVGRPPNGRGSLATSEGWGSPDTPDDGNGAQGAYIYPRRLEISPSEMEFISDLAPLLGRSPRALKRFVNVYRLIKAGLSEQEDRRFLTEGQLLSDYQAVLFLLAIDTGLPHVAQDFFDALPSTPGQNIGLRTLVDSFPNGPSSQDVTGEWSRLKEWLVPEDASREEPRRLRLPDDLRTLVAWKRRVLRYSFRSEQT